MRKENFSTDLDKLSNAHLIYHCVNLWTLFQALSSYLHVDRHDAEVRTRQQNASEAFNQAKGAILRRMRKVSELGRRADAVDAAITECQAARKALADVLDKRPSGPLPFGEDPAVDRYRRAGVALDDAYRAALVALDEAHSAAMQDVK